MVLDGYVNVVRNDNLTFLNGTVDDSFYNRYRVCVRYNGQVSVTLAGQNIVTSSANAGDYDATLVCQDDNDLQQGLLPLTVQYASNPTQRSTILQLFIIPVAQVWAADNPQDPSTPYQYTYNCSCCGLFGASGQGCDSCGPCCEALNTCDFMTASCSGQAQNGAVLSPPGNPSPTPKATPVASPSSPAAITTPAASPTATPAATGVVSCNDSPPNSQYTCQEQARYGKCGDPFMFVAGAPKGGYCAASCNRCPPGTSPSVSPTPSPPASTPTAPGPSPARTASPAATASPTAEASPAATAIPVATSTPAASAAPSPSPGQTASPSGSCLDTPPDSQHSCQEQASYGKCGDPFMFVAGAPAGGYCAASCHRCPPGTTPTPSTSPRPVSGSSPAGEQLFFCSVPSFCMALLYDFRSICSGRTACAMLHVGEGQQRSNAFIPAYTFIDIPAYTLMDIQCCIHSCAGVVIHAHSNLHVQSCMYMIHLQLLMHNQGLLPAGHRQFSCVFVGAFA